MTNMKRAQRWVVGGAMLAAVALTGGTVEAGFSEIVIGEVNIDLYVAGSEASAIDDYLPELYIGGSDEFFTECTPVGGADEALAALRSFRCDVHTTTTYTLGFTTAYPEPYTVEFDCIEDPLILNPPEAFVDESATFTVDGENVSRVDCSIYLATNMVFIDKTFAEPTFTDPDGAATVSDFDLQVYTGAGELYANEVDIDGDICGSYEDVASEVCAMFEVPDGDFVIGEVSPEYGYRTLGVECESVGSPLSIITEPIGPIGGPGLTTGSGAFDTGATLEMLDQFEGASITFPGIVPGESTACVVTNAYSEGDITLTKTLVNDNGGTAALTDFTLQLFDADGMLVDEGVCDTDGLCLEGSYPIGVYRVGETGPTGYTQTVNVTVTEPTEMLTVENATFSLGADELVEVEVVNDDIVPPTTTTTTTTVVPTTTTTVVPTTTTTVVPTTTTTVGAQTTTTDQGAGAGVPTTTINPTSVTLPATGGGDSAATLALLSLMVLLAGAGAITVARRTS